MKPRKRKVGHPVRKPTTWLAFFMLRREITMARLAEATGFSTQTIQSWRHGASMPIAKHMARLADVTLQIEKEMGVTKPRGVLVTDWFRDPPTEDDQRKMVPWLFESSSTEASA